jgi:hypothetical protein
MKMGGTINIDAYIKFLQVFHFFHHHKQLLHQRWLTIFALHSDNILLIHNNAIVNASSTVNEFLQSAGVSLFSTNPPISWIQMPWTNLHSAPLNRSATNTLF